jgi:uncharacterized protein
LNLGRKNLKEGSHQKMQRNKRYLEQEISNVLTSKKMVFVGGPRQVGKTTMCFSFLGPQANEQHPGYLNWDNPDVARAILQMRLPVNEPTIIFDEIHKYARWRNLIKGIYDTNRSTIQILVTGSARLDYYRKGGDSLANRYRYFRLHPFSITELSTNPNGSDLKALLDFGGFPEPLFSQDDRLHRIWQRDRISRVVKQDLRDLEHVREISLVERLVDMLPERAGSVLSVNSLREDLSVDHKSVERWLTITENLYYSFRILPYGPPKIRAVKKERKLYLWDWSEVRDSGRRFENMVASHLLKYCHWMEDFEGYKTELRFLRDVEKREIDFIVIKDGKAQFAVECKTGERQISGSLKYFSDRVDIPKFYQVHMGSKHFQEGKIEVIPFIKFCQKLGLP